MSITFTDPKTGKSYRYNGFMTPLRRISSNCQYGWHDSCLSKASDLVQVLSAEATKKMCCLCECHHD